MTNQAINYTFAVYCQQQDPCYQEAQLMAQNLEASLISDLDNITCDCQYLLFWRSMNGTVSLSIIKVSDYFGDLSKLKMSINKGIGSLSVDYSNGVIAGKKCYKFTYNDALPKAMGLAKFKDQSVSILDGTAGFTLDAYALLQLSSNLKITLLENSKVLFYLVNDGLLRARCGANMLTQNIAQRMTLVNKNFIDYLKADNNSDYQIIYLDPMFEKDKSAAKPKQNMQLLQDICSNPNDVAELICAALTSKNKRIVLKRSIKQAKLFEKYINYSVESKQIRYDVYLV